MPTIDTFLSAAKAIVTFGAAANASARADIRNVVGTLADELDRALTLTDAYIVGASFVKRPTDFAKYLADGYPKIMKNMSDYKVCAAIEQLADEFKQIFNVKKIAVSANAIGEIPRLVKELQSGEAAVIDSVGDILNDMTARAIAIQKASPRLRVAQIEEAKLMLVDGRTKIDLLRRRVKSTRRQLLAKL
jgi:hypothetical protein